MDKVILYKRNQRKDLVFDISTEEKKNEAFKKLFEIFDNYNAFSYDKKIENKKEKLKTYQNSEFKSDGQVFIDFGDKYVKQYSENEWKEKIKRIKSDLKKWEKRKKKYERAKDGDIETIKEIVKMKRGKYKAEYRVVEVENS